VTGEPDYEQLVADAAARSAEAAWIAACHWIITLINAELASTPPYTDNRNLVSLRTQAEDKIRAIQNGE
jgi:hypothetical protein